MRVRWAAAVIHRILCSLLKNRLMLCSPQLVVSVPVLGEIGGSDWGSHFHSMSVRCLSTHQQPPDLLHFLAAFYSESKRCDLLFVLVFQPILPSGPCREFKSVLKVLLTHDFIA